MDFLYGGAFRTGLPEAYERLILDAMLGDATLFTREDEVDEQWKLVLWAVGVGLDLLLILVLSGNKILEQVQARFAENATTRRRPRSRVRPDGEGPLIHGVSVDPALLSERLGLFVIILLGESVVQVVGAASRTQYGVGLLATAIASFVLLAGMFGLSVVFGYAGLPSVHGSMRMT